MPTDDYEPSDVPGFLVLSESDPIRRKRACERLSAAMQDSVIECVATLKEVVDFIEANPKYVHVTYASAPVLCNMVLAGRRYDIRAVMGRLAKIDGKIDWLTAEANRANMIIHGDGNGEKSLKVRLILLNQSVEATDKTVVELRGVITKVAWIIIGSVLVAVLGLVLVKR